MQDRVPGADHELEQSWAAQREVEDDLRRLRQPVGELGPSDRRPEPLQRAARADRIGRVADGVRLGDPGG